MLTPFTLNNWPKIWKLEKEGKGTLCGFTGAVFLEPVFCLQFEGKESKHRQEGARRRTRVGKGLSSCATAVLQLLSI